MNEYPNSPILASVDWLKEHLNDANLRLLDVRVSDPRFPVGYRMGHIPNAIAFDPGRQLYIPTGHGHDLAPAEQIANGLGECGVANDSVVVIYDEWTGQLAAMTFWALSGLGHRHLKILHGGWTAWQANDNPVTRDAPRFAQVAYRPEPRPDYRATADWIQANASRRDVLLLDARSDGEYEMGHIPGAINLPWEFSLEPRTQTFRDAATLKTQIESVGATQDKEIVVYCASGARSSHLFTTLALMGYPRIRNYEGSMMDWYQARGLPVE